MMTEPTAERADRIESLPRGWRRVRLGELLRLRQEVVHPRDKPRGRAIFVGLEHIESGTGRRTGAVDVEKAHLTGRKPQFGKGDIVYGYLRPYLNKVWVAEFDGLCSVDQYVYVVDGKRADGAFLAWFMRSPIYLARAPIDLTPGQLPRIRTEEVAAVELALPPLAEQKRIAALLAERMATVERARAAAQARLEAGNTLREAYLRRAFHNITPLAAGPDRDTAPPGWSWRLLTILARLESGHTPSRYHPEWWRGSIPWIALPDIRELDGKVAYETSEYTNEAGIANSSARVLPAGTVVMSRTASVGFVTIMGRGMATSQDFVNWVCGPELDPNFLALLLQASRRYIRSLSSGAVHQTVYVPTVKAFDVCVPSLLEQQRTAKTLAEQFGAAEKLRLALDGELASINALPAALLRLAFSGQL